jgi:hypothetical protein
MIHDRRLCHEQHSPPGMGKGHAKARCRYYRCKSYLESEYCARASMPNFLA